MSGREIRVAEVAGDATGAHRDAIADIHQDRLDALVVRRGFPEEVRRAILARVAGDEALPWLRPNQRGPQADIRVLGVAATPTFATPGGPPVDAYFEDAARYDAIYDQLLGAGPGVPHHLETLLAGLSGGRPVARLALPDGRRFAACTVRALPEGQRIIVHNDHSHFQLPVYRDVVGQLDTSASLSFLVLLQAPEAGGELVIHGVSHADPVPRLPSGMPDGAAIQAGFPARRIAMAEGDLLLFAAGRLYHHVAPTVGPRPRITLGGFLTLDRDHRTVRYWN
jgi:hypothetical protein